MLPKKKKEINILRKSTVSFRIYDIVAPNAPISGNVTLPTPVRILIRKLTYHIGIVNLRKKGVELAQKTKEINILRKPTGFFFMK